MGGERERTYPRSVGVLGHGFLAEPVLQRLLRALPAATYISTYGRDPDLLTQLQRLGARRATSAADLAARSEYILVLLHKLDDLEAELSGPSGLQAGVHSPTRTSPSASRTVSRPPSWWARGWRCLRRRYSSRSRSVTAWRESARPVIMAVS